MIELPSQEYLQSRIEYNPETGEARWKPVDESYGPNWKVFNSRYCGTKINKKYVGIYGVRIPTARALYKLYHGVDPVTTIVFADGNNSNFNINNITSAKQKLSIDKSLLLSARPIPDETANLLRYDHISGKLFWKERGDKVFDGRYAGREAGNLRSDKYIDVRVTNKLYRAHRISWLLYYNTDPANYLIDHIDCNPSNNSIKNLRLATKSFNSQAASTDAKGCAIRNSGRYTASILINSTRKNLGTFDTEAEAKQAYDEALAKYKPVYQFTEEEQGLLEELYANYPNVTRDLQRQCHELQVKALNHYIEGAAQ